MISLLTYTYWYCD